MSNSVPNLENTIREQVLSEDSYKKMQRRIEGVPDDKTQQHKFEITGAAATIIGATQKARQYREEIQAQLPKFPVALFDDIETMAYAALYANSVYQVAAEPKDELQPLLELALSKSVLLQADASTLAKRGLINPEVLSQLSSERGYKATAANLQLLYTVLDNNWEKIVGKCAIDRAELDLAGRLAGRIVRLVGLREQSPAAVADAAKLRGKAFTLMVNSWEEIRRAIQYVRYAEGDADEIAPSLYANRKRRNNEPEVPVVPPPVVPDPTQPTNNPTPVNRNLNIPGGNPFGG